MKPEGERYFVTFLREEWERRRQRNNRYSMRAFARQLGIHQSGLSRILAGKQTLSVAVCRQILEAIPATAELRGALVRSMTDDRNRRDLELLDQPLRSRPDSIDRAVVRAFADDVRRYRQQGDVSPAEQQALRWCAALPCGSC